MATLKTLAYLVIYPGLLFIFFYSTFAEWYDRKLYARLQNRMGPTHTGRAGVLQPIADFIKLMSKEDIVPERADRGLFRALPAFGLAIVSVGMLLLPVWNYNLGSSSPISFSGDIVVLLYLFEPADFLSFS